MQPKLTPFRVGRRAFETGGEARDYAEHLAVNGGHCPRVVRTPGKYAPKSAQEHVSEEDRTTWLEWLRKIDRTLLTRKGFHRGCYRARRQPARNY